MLLTICHSLAIIFTFREINFPSAQAGDGMEETRDISVHLVFDMFQNVVRILMHTAHTQKASE